MVSEDSQDLGGFPVVHRLNDPRDLDQAIDREVSTETHQSDDLGELVEVVTLRCSKSMLLKERDNHVPQVAVSLHAVPEEILPVIVMSTISVDPPASEESDEVL